MILRTLICVLALTLFCGTGVQAQVVTVRGGNHDGFSRLVFYFQAGREWSLQKTDTGHLLSIDLESLGLRLSEVFEKIGRDKVTGITADRNRSTILIQTGCDCTLKAALLRPGMLVVDVHDAPLFSKLAQLTFVQGEILNGQIGKFGAPKAVPNGKSPEIPQKLDLPPIGILTPLSVPAAPTFTLMGSTRDLAPPEQIPQAIPEIGASKPTQSPLDPRLDQTRNAVLGEISKATEQGLLLSRTKKQPTPTGNDEIADVETILNSLNNSRVESSIDFGVAKDGKGPHLTANGDLCIPDQSLDIANWAPESDPVENISRFRLSLFEEFDSPNRDAAVGLVKTYVYLTFGAEASKILDRFDVTGADADILRTMAEIVDHGFASHSDLFAEQITCDSDVALWAALSIENFPRALAMNTGAIQLAFFEMPIHLRRHLGPSLALRFLDYGDLNTAITIRDAIDRATGTPGDAFKLLNAKIDLELGNEAEASDGFDALSDSNSAMAPDALIERIDLAIQSQGDLPKGAVESVAALAFEHRGTKIGARLARSYVVANIVEHRFDEALSSLLRIETGEESEKLVFPDLWSKLALGMARTDDDVIFLSAYYKHKKTLAEREVSHAARSKLAKRLTRLGFGNDALEELAFYPSTGTLEEVLERANAMISANQYDEARKILGTVKAPPARALLAHLQEKAHQFSSAASIYGELEDLEAQARANWRAGNWDGVAQHSSGKRLVAAQMMTSPEPHSLSQSPDDMDANEKSGVIASNEILLTHSAWVRSALQDLLEMQ